MVFCDRQSITELENGEEKQDDVKQNEQGKGSTAESQENDLCSLVPGFGYGAAISDRANPGDRIHALSYAYSGASLWVCLRLALGGHGGICFAPASFRDLRHAYHVSGSCIHGL